MARSSSRRKGPRRGGGGQVGLWPYAIAIGVAAVVVAIFIVVMSVGGDGDGGDGGGGPVVLPSPRPTEIAQDGHLLGSADAPVTLIEYADFQ